MEKNETLLQAFEWYLPVGGHWRLLTGMAQDLAAAGFTALWLPPAYKGQAGADDVGYGVYDTYDLGEFDQKGSVPTKYGSRDEYIAAVKALQRAGVAVWADMVLNHRMGADETQDVLASVARAEDRCRTAEGERLIRAWTRFTFPGRGGKYSSFTWNWTHFDGVDWSDTDRRKAVFRFHGKEWDAAVDAENGNYDYLMGADLDMSNPEVLEELKRWGRWYLDTTGVDGFRLDAVKHMRFTFFREWLDDLRAYSGRPLPAVGEYWSPDLTRLLRYLNESGRRARLFDVPFHFRLQRASDSQGRRDMARLRQGTLWQAEPDSAVTFVDNHDTQPGQALESWVLGWFKPLAYALLLLQKGGLPCVFWGDWAGIPHDGIGPVPELPALVRLRQTNAYGEERPYFDHPDIVGLTRLGDGEHPGLALLLTDGPGGCKSMYVGHRYAGAGFHDALGRCSGTVPIAADGTGCFRVEGGGVCVWVP